MPLNIADDAALLEILSKPHQCDRMPPSSDNSVPLIPPMLLVTIIDDRPQDAAQGLHELLDLGHINFLMSFIYTIPRCDTIEEERYETLRASGFLLALADAFVEVMSYDLCPKGPGLEEESCVEVSLIFAFCKGVADQIHSASHRRVLPPFCDVHRESIMPEAGRQHSITLRTSHKCL